MTKVDQAIENLRQAIIEEMGDQVVSAKVFFNCYETDIEISKRTPEQLKMQGVSMKNLSGEWVK